VSPFHNIPLRSRKTIALYTKRLQRNETALCTKKLAMVVQKSDRDGKIRDENFLIFAHISESDIQSEKNTLIHFLCPFSISQIKSSPLCTWMSAHVLSKNFLFSMHPDVTE